MRASGNRGSSAPGSGARSGWRYVPWSIRACRTRARTAPVPTGRGVESIRREAASAPDLRSLAGGAAPRPRASDATVTIAARIEWTHRTNGRPRPRIRRFAISRRPQTVAPPTFSRHVAYSPGVSASPSSRRRRAPLRWLFNQTGAGLDGAEEQLVRSSARSILEVKSEFHRLGARRDIVGPTERREEVVQRQAVSQVDDRKPQAPFIAVSVEKVVLPQS